MGMFYHLVLVLCTLHVLFSYSPTVNASRRPWTSAGTSGAEGRKARAANRPAPVECKLGNWGSWSPCTSCTDKKFRFRYLEKPSQFQGTDCIDTLWEKLACPTATTKCMVPDYCGESFTCEGTGRCVSQSLRCNGDYDCEDLSDESGCASFNQRDDKCASILSIPGAERGTQGFHILSGELMDHVLDSKYFGGQCEYVYNGEWRKFAYDAFCENLHYNEDLKNFRKPYNYHSYRFVAEATSEGSSEYYEDALSLLNARKEERSGNAGFTVGVAYVEVGLKASAETTFLTNITKHRSQDSAFVRLSSKVQTARFKMRTDKLMLHEDFYVALMDLPEQYDFGMYSRLFNTFGTHYVTEGTMGGTLEYVLVLDKKSVLDSKLEGSEIGGCLGASLGLGKPFGTQVTAGLKLKGNLCGKTGDFQGETHASSVSVEDIVTLVKGGITYSSSGLLAIRNPDTYKAWGASLQYNPALIDYEIMPIYELVRSSTAAGHVGARLPNLQRAYDEYLQQFDPCRCVPCQNNGQVVLTGTACKCICKSGYQGDACEETHGRETKTDGVWSCWGPWSSCASGKKTRTRSCTNPPPKDGGAACLGSSAQSQRC
ncbi:complement component C8 alpha chain [Betta splendens]|uniref:Complement component C8 alpha chain n=1 Tax=Betta splendens TaxID=158456 RepID=A0A6P7KWY0_BETSP|nr:complement component C8 alpha chain [Betta splendens]